MSMAKIRAAPRILAPLKQLQNGSQNLKTSHVTFPCVFFGWAWGGKGSSNSLCFQCFMASVYMRVVLNSFIWKTSSSPKKIFFRRTFANSMFFFRGSCWPRFSRKTWMCDILKLFQASDPSSHFILRQLHLNIYVLL